MSKIAEVASLVGDALHVLARIADSQRRIEREQSTMRATLDKLLLQQQKSSQEAVGLAALLGAEVESEEEREEREKLEKEFAEFQSIMKQIEEV